MANFAAWKEFQKCLGEKKKEFFFTLCVVILRVTFDLLTCVFYFSSPMQPHESIHKDGWQMHVPERLAPDKIARYT